MEALEPFGGITEEEYRDCFRRMCRRGAAAGADLIVLETFMDGRSLKIAAEEAAETGLPLMCSLSFAKNNRTFFGTGIDEILERSFRRRRTYRSCLSRTPRIWGRKNSRRPQSLPFPR